MNIKENIIKRFKATESGFGNMTEREKQLLAIAIDELSKPLPSEEEISSFLKNLNIWEDQTDCFDKGTTFWENGGLSGVIQKAIQHFGSTGYVHKEAKDFIQQQVKVMTHLIDEIDVVTDYLVVNKQPDKAAIVSNRKYLIEESYSKLIEMCDRSEPQGTGYVSDEDIKNECLRIASSGEVTMFHAKDWMSGAMWMRDQLKSPWISVDEAVISFNISDDKRTEFLGTFSLRNIIDLIQEDIIIDNTNDSCSSATCNSESQNFCDCGSDYEHFYISEFKIGDEN